MAPLTLRSSRRRSGVGLRLGLQRALARRRTQRQTSSGAFGVLFAIRYGVQSAQIGTTLIVSTVASALTLAASLPIAAMHQHARAGLPELASDKPADPVCRTGDQCRLSAFPC